MFAALTNRSLDDFVWHRAVDDACATAAVLQSTAFRAMLANLDDTKALIALDQLVLAVHHEHNERVKAATRTGAPAGKKRRTSTCTYCGERELPAHLSRRTCPKRLRDEGADPAPRAPPKRRPAVVESDEEEDGEENDEDETYDVAAIHGQRGSGRNIEYHVEWEGYPDELTWEPRGHLEGCSVLDDYLAAHGK